MKFTIKPVTNSQEMSAFLDVPKKVYANDTNWVPPLNSSIKKELGEDSSFLEYGEFAKFIAISETSQEVLGRIVAAINHKLIAKENKQVGIFGYFECVNDYQIAEALLETACNWMGDRQIVMVRGPINLSTHNSCMFLADGFDSPPTMMMPYNPPYYPEFILRHGWTKVKEAYAYLLPLNQSLPAKFKKAYQICCKSGITFRSINLKEEGWKKDCEQIYQYMTQGFSQSWSYTPWTREEFFQEAEDLRSVVDTDIFIIAEDKDQMVGFCFALPDYNLALKHVNGKLDWLGIIKLLWYRRQINRARVSTIFSLPEYRRQMVSLSIIYLLMEQGTKAGKKYQEAELSWVWQDNLPSRKLTEASGAKLHKTYHIYEKLL